MVVSLIAFVRATDLDSVLASVSRVGYNFVWLLLLTGGAYYSAAISWRYCLGHSCKKLSAFRLFLIRHIGETVGLFNPTSVVGGDAVKVVLLGNYGIDRKRVIASVVLSRLILIASQLALFLLTVLGIVLQGSAFKEAPLQAQAMGLYSFVYSKTNGVRVKIADILKELYPFFRNHKKALAWSAVFALLHWLLGAFEFFFILKFLGVEVTVLQALLIDLGVVFFKAAGAFIPGQIGVEEFGNKLMLASIGVPDPEIWISASILRRARQLVWVALGAFAWLFLYRQHHLSAKARPLPVKE